MPTVHGDGQISPGLQQILRSPLVQHTLPPWQQVLPHSSHGPSSVRRHAPLQQVPNMPVHFDLQLPDAKSHCSHCSLSHIPGNSKHWPLIQVPQPPHSASSQQPSLSGTQRLFGHARSKYGQQLLPAMQPPPHCFSPGQHSPGLAHLPPPHFTRPLGQRFFFFFFFLFLPPASVSLNPMRPAMAPSAPPPTMRSAFRRGGWPTEEPG
jgi:hypothetical protein